MRSSVVTNHDSCQPSRRRRRHHRTAWQLAREATLGARLAENSAINGRISSTDHPHDPCVYCKDYFPRYPIMEPCFPMCWACFWSLELLPSSSRASRLLGWGGDWGGAGEEASCAKNERLHGSQPPLSHNNGALVGGSWKTDRGRSVLTVTAHCSLLTAPRSRAWVLTLATWPCQQAYASFGG